MAESSSLAVRPMEADDWPAVRSIYLEGIATGNATFEEEAPSWEVFSGRRFDAHRLVAHGDSGAVLGWTAAGLMLDRPCYAGVVEHAVYIARAARGAGVGRRLLNELIAVTEAAGRWTIQSGIFPENQASRALHRSCGFRELGTRERIGEHRGRWRDVILIERRSPVIG